MRLFLTLFREYPRRSSLVLLCLVLSVFADGIGISTWLPLITLLMGDGAAAKAPNQFEERVVGALNGLGLEPTLGVLLSIMLFAAVLKGALNLLSKRQVGGIIFTTVQKFGLIEDEDQHPALNERENIIVISDEAHRSQYGHQAKLDTKTGAIQVRLCQALA